MTQGVGVMTDEQLKLKEIQPPLIFTPPLDHPFTPSGRIFLLLYFQKKSSEGGEGTAERKRTEERDKEMEDTVHDSVWTTS